MNTDDAPRPLRILYPANVDFPCFRANSIQIVRMAHALARNGARVALVVRRASRRDSVKAVLEEMRLAPHPNLRIVRIPVVQRFRGGLWDKISNLSFYPGCLAAALALAVLARIDAIFVRLDTRRVYWFFRRLRDLLGAKLVFECHEIMFEAVEQREVSPPVDPSTLGRQARQCWRQEKAIGATADGIVFTNRALEREFRRRFRVRQPTRVLPSATAFAPADAPQPRPEKHVVYCGHLLPSKGVDLLVEAMALLPADARLTIVGGPKPSESFARPDDCTESIKSRARALGLGDRVRITGFVSPSETARYVSEAAVAVLPTRRTPQGRFNSPLKLFEYMSLGKPIVASDLEGICEILEHERNALIFRAGDASDLADKLGRLLDSPELRERLARQALVDAAQYTWDNRAREILRFAASLRKGRAIEP